MYIKRKEKQITSLSGSESALNSELIYKLLEGVFKWLFGNIKI